MKRWDVRRSYLTSRIVLGVTLWPGSWVDALAYPEGAPWETAADPDGCRRCHFDSGEPVASTDLSMHGLPSRLVAGKRYTLVLRLENESLRRAGFLLTVTAAGQPAGQLSPAGNVSDSTDVAAVETHEAQARSTAAGARLGTTGRAEWRVVWEAPLSTDDVVTFDVWANAGNDDQSPLGDKTYHDRWQLPVDSHQESQ